MTQPTMVKQFGKRMIDAVRAHVSRALGPITDELLALRNKLEALPVPKDGVDGRNGIDGKNGAPGLQGERGEVGIQGERGDPGLNGAHGERGPEGAAGATGERGEPGPQGEIGLQGDQGISGEKGERGEPGPKGEPGKDGTDGADGIDGLAGEPGKDAPDITVLSEIDEAKIYPKGTFAYHRGGMIHAKRKTSPITDSLQVAGWHVVVNGIAEELEEGLDDGMARRTTVYTSGHEMVRDLRIGDDLVAMVEARIASWEVELVRRSLAAMERAVAQLPKPKDGEDGEPGGSIDDFAVAMEGRVLTVAMRIGDEVIRKEIRMDMPIYRDVFQSGKTYDKDDCVTYAGSMFIATRETKDKPESSTAWKLIVKRGRDGKDAKIIEPA